MRYSGRFAALAGTVLFSAGIAHAGYLLDTTYDSTNFFNSFDFFTLPDPTGGFVQYVDGQTANQEGLAVYAKGGIYMGVDSKTKNPPNGRKSVRVSSKKSFTRGLFIADIAHMPGSICGTWPAFWLLGPGWPSSGEIDILEGVNAQTQNSITLHTANGCTMSNQGALPSTQFSSADCGALGASKGCQQATVDASNYGDGFNAIGGGVYATEWTSDHIAVWFFPRSNIPQDITFQNPNPGSWGAPTARFVGGNTCNINNFFKDHQIVFDTTFCGQWAGDVWKNDAKCSTLAPTCQEYVSGNPEQFANAFWVVNSVKVYQQGGSPGPVQHFAAINPSSGLVGPQDQNHPQPQTQVQPQSTQPATQPQPTNGQVWNGQPQPNSNTNSQPPPPKQDNSWNGQVWNGGGWNSKRRNRAVEKRFSA
ncbi:Concanavalin A-like lectin/glucanase [Metarhizium brunneum]